MHMGPGLSNCQTCMSGDAVALHLAAAARHKPSAGPLTSKTGALRLWRKRCGFSPSNSPWASTSPLLPMMLLLLLVLLSAAAGGAGTAADRGVPPEAAEANWRSPRNRGQGKLELELVRHATAAAAAAAHGVLMS